jgi:hypothetical protein
MEGMDWYGISDDFVPPMVIKEGVPAAGCGRRKNEIFGSRQPIYPCGEREG